MADLFTPKLLILYLFILSAIYVHFRGKVRHSFFRQLGDHSTLMAPVNCIMYMFSRVPNKPYLENNYFPEMRIFKDNWQTIRDEALNAAQVGHVKKSEKLDDLAFNSFFRTGWKRFYLKWYQDYLPSAQELCPKTIELLKQTPSVKAAMFTLLPPDATLVRHRDPYAGSIRYHLGLVTPNSDDCFIRVDGEDYSWRNGEDVFFDETFIHHAENNTKKDRLIFFCDVERPMNNPIARWFNRFFGRIVVSAAATKNADTDKVGILNRVFHYVYQIRLVGKRLKKYNKHLYYTVKYIIYAGIIYLIFF
ncbi:MAG: lipid A hydroxylase LpxO [Gammaproteobacteria bacterium]|nr:MAG: lipid A hydroxylase LpxO [Gammaproteobacteria bacterium]